MRPLENTAAESSAEVASSIIRVFDVRKLFKSGDEEIEALRGVSFEVPPGACSFFVGPSGSGKSTLLYLLGALDRPTSGTIEIGGQNLTAMNEVEQDVFRRQKIGFVFQQFNLIPNLSAVENVLLPFIPHETSRSRLQAYALQTAALLKTDRNTAIRRGTGVATLVDAAPKLSQAQRDTLAALLAGDDGGAM